MDNRKDMQGISCQTPLPFFSFLCFSVRLVSVCFFGCVVLLFLFFYFSTDTVVLFSFRFVSSRLFFNFRLL